MFVPKGSSVFEAVRLGFTDTDYMVQIMSYIASIDSHNVKCSVNRLSHELKNMAERLRVKSSVTRVTA